ncbi:calcium-transporting ATPase 5, plasma membrane-type-like [Musa acuminata AAA Group]|uniref:calcium-transporting ATPase 5, plasma membrane-type-like n=1 Tax=Musa acuminata AAA Group TaxID=214697 RepID=UPI0031CE8BBB
MDPPSPERYARQRDEECGLADAAAAALGDEGEITCEDDAFDIPAKNAPVERLHRWRQAALVLNASRRFRYTLDLKKEKEKEDLRRKIRTHAQVIRAAFLFKEAGEREAPDASGEKPVIPKDGFPISVDKLTTLTREHDFARLQEYGGASSLRFKCIIVNLHPMLFTWLSW